MVDPGIGHTKIYERTQGSGAAKDKKGEDMNFYFNVAGVLFTIYFVGNVIYIIYLVSDIIYWKKSSAKANESTDGD
jgi:hypothetical protein